MNFNPNTKFINSNTSEKVGKEAPRGLLDDLTWVNVADIYQ
jgi:hypothetical protein